MATEIEKMGWADKLFRWFSKDVRTTGLMLMTLFCALLIQEIRRLNSEKDLLNDKLNATTEKGLERVIAEVEKRQDPRFKAMENRIDTIKQNADSTGENVKATTGIVQQAVGDIKKALNIKTHK